MDEIQYLTLNSEFAENEDYDQIKGKSYANDEENADGDDRRAETSDKYLDEIAPVISTHTEHTHSSNHDANDEQNADENSDSDRQTESPNKFINADIPVVQTFTPRTHSKTDLHIEPNTNDDNLKVESHRTELMFNDPGERKNIQYKSLNEYLNKHERFLRLIDSNRQLSNHERKQLNKQKEDLKNLQKKLAKQVEENNLKRLYEKQKKDDMLSKRRAYLQRRVQETKLKETRKPRIETTFHLPIKEKRSNSQMTQKKSNTNQMEPSSISPINQPKSVAWYMSNTDSTPVSQDHNIGKDFKDLIVQFVENSKRSWTN